MLKYLLAFSITCFGFAASARPFQTEAPRQHADSVIYHSATLTLRKISSHTYVHTSYLETQSFGKVPCNGMIVVDGREAVVFDTPANAESSRELIQFLTTQMAVKINAVIATHFHADCVAGLNEFHNHQISSYAENRTLKIMAAKNTGFNMPQKGFKNKLRLKVGDRKVYAAYLGEGHTRDNVVGYFPVDQVVFGGCLIKEMGAGKGNLEDANTIAWSKTAASIKNTFPQIKIVIPGHGKPGGTELIDYTVQMFQKTGN